MATKTNKNETINIYECANDIVKRVSESTKNFITGTIEFGATDEDIKKLLNYTVDGLVEAFNDRYSVNVEIKPIIKNILYKELGYEFLLM